MTYIDKLFNLDCKVVVVIGAGGHLCSEMARGFANAGCAVILLDANISGAEDVASKIRDDGGRALALKMDVNQKQDFERCLKKILNEFDRVDVLINGAGINAPTPFLEIREEEWDHILSVNLKGTLFGCQVFGRQMLKHGSGSIINISSASAGPPLSKAFTYSVAKAGIISMTRYLATLWAKKGIRVNCISPAGVYKKHDKKFVEQLSQRIPLGRMAKLHEFNGAIIYLCSNASSFVTGHNLVIDGGRTIW